MNTKRPATRIEIRDFPGLMLNADPLETPPGAGREQVNAIGSKPAELTVRPGFRPVQFEDES